MGNARIIPKKAALLLPYQERWVKDPARLKIMEKANIHMDLNYIILWANWLRSLMMKTPGF